MKRATITFPDDLERELEAYLVRQPTPPSLTTLVQTALREYLQAEALRERQYRSGRGVFTPPVAEKGSGKHDISVDHDRYSVEG